MEKAEYNTVQTDKAPVHRWNAETRTNTCGAPGQTGSTKHDRGVTCNACLELLGREPHTPVHH